MQRMLAKRMSQLLIPNASDEVLFGFSLPSDTVVHDIRAEVHYTGPVLTVSNALMVGLEMYVLPVTDPDNGASYNTIWDQLVPKDTDAETVDLDTSGLDTQPFWEPGEPDWTQLFDIGVRPRKLFGKYEMITIVNTDGFSFEDTNTPFSVKWLPARKVQVRVRRRFRVSQPSVVVCALGIAGGDDTTTTIETALAENEWARVKYISHVLEFAISHLFGLTESGAETPWEEATALLKKILEPDPVEETAGTFNSQALNVFSRARMDFSVTGDLEKMLVTSGRG